MKQRVKLAQSLAHDPVVVQLDEPTAALDPSGREEMLRLIRRIGHEFGISIILSSHLMGAVYGFQAGRPFVEFTAAMHGLNPMAESVDPGHRNGGP